MPLDIKVDDNDEIIVTNPWDSSESQSVGKREDLNTVHLQISITNLIYSYANIEIQKQRDKVNDAQFKYVQMRERFELLEKLYDELRSLIVITIEDIKKPFVQRITEHRAFWPTCITLSIILALGGVVYVQKMYGW